MCVTNINKFYKTVSSFFSIKSKVNAKIVLTEGRKVDNSDIKYV